MATLDWTKFNHKVEIKSTKKKMYGRFYFSGQYFCPGGRILQSSHPTIEDAIQHRIEWHKSYNYGGSWRAAKEHINEILAERLLDFKQTINQFQGQIKVRVEEPYVTFYTETEEKLEEVITSLPAWRKDLKTVHLTDPKLKDLLEQNFVITKVDLGYSHKVVLKDGNYKNKPNIQSYLEGLGDVVKVSTSVYRNLEKSYPYAWGIWFYTNDPNVVVMLNMIEPGCVSNIHEIHCTNKYLTINV